jgi:DNA-binding XRE family transcriptional regulator
MNMMRAQRQVWGEKIERHRTNPARPSSGPADPGGALTQEAFAALLGVTQPTVSGWEKGEAAPREYLRPRVAAVLGTHHSVLFSYTLPMEAA